MFYAAKINHKTITIIITVFFSIEKSLSQKPRLFLIFLLIIGSFLSDYNNKQFRSNFKRFVDRCTYGFLSQQDGCKKRKSLTLLLLFLYNKDIILDNFKTIFLTVRKNLIIH